MMSRKNRKILCDCIIILVMLALAVAFLMPYLWMILDSLKKKKEILKGTSFFPKTVMWDNYKTVFNDAPVFQWLLNSTITTVAGTLFVLFTSSICGFVFAKYQFKGKNVLFMVILATIMVPAQVTMIPSFLLIDKLGMYDTLWSLIVPGIVSGSGIFMCRAYAEGIPDALCEAAYIDGAGDIFIYTRIILPLIRPALGALTIFTFLNKWNDYLGPLLYLNKKENMTLPLAITWFQSQKSTDIGAIMAASVLVTTPVTIVYLCLQKQFVKGIAITGMK